MPRAKFLENARVRVSGSEWKTLYLAGKVYELPEESVWRWVRRGIAVDLTPPPQPIPEDELEDKPEPPPPPPPKKTRRKRKSSKQ